MKNHKNNLTTLVLELLALASKLEGEGQYNLAKLCRAAADSLCRKTAYQLPMPDNKQELAKNINYLAESLNTTDFDIKHIVIRSTKVLPSWLRAACR